MNRLILVVLMCLSSVAFAGTGDPVPLCPEGSPPDCVDPNWGQIEPGATDLAGASSGPSLLAGRDLSKSRSPVHMLPTAAPSGMAAPDHAATLKSVVSPQRLFPKETAALVTALRRARFNDDGSIRTGEAAIRRAAEAAARRAGTKYVLTLYIKVPQKLKPEQGVALGKKVDALNVVLSGPSSAGQAGTPKT